MQDDNEETGVGTDAADDLGAGQFDEGESHKSFLEALNEWRNANRPAQQEVRTGKMFWASPSMPLPHLILSYSLSQGPRRSNNGGTNRHPIQCATAPISKTVLFQQVCAQHNIKAGWEHCKYRYECITFVPCAACSINS